MNLNLNTFSYSLKHLDILICTPLKFLKVFVGIYKKRNPKQDDSSDIDIDELS